MFKILTKIMGVMTFASLLSFGVPTYAESDQVIKLAALKFGTVKWELQTIQKLGLDKKHGFTLEIQNVAGKQASTLAIQNDAADVIVTDWLWVANQKSSGRSYQFVPYSTSVGGLLVSNDSSIKSLKDLKGKRIGIAGGPVDKSWVIIQALGKKDYGVDLAADNELVFGAPPLLFKQALNGEIDAIINFWHYLAKLEAKGFRKVVDVQKASQKLGLSADTPLLGYVFKESWAIKNPDLVSGLRKASLEAKAILGSDDSAWNDLKKLMKSKSDAEFLALRNAWRKGIPGSAIDYSSAKTMFLFMQKHSAGKLIKKDSVFEPSIFLANTRQ